LAGIEGLWWVLDALLLLLHANAFLSWDAVVGRTHVNWLSGSLGWASALLEEGFGVQVALGSSASDLLSLAVSAAVSLAGTGDWKWMMDLSACLSWEAVGALAKLSWDTVGLVSKILWSLWWWLDSVLSAFLHPSSVAPSLVASNVSVSAVVALGILADAWVVLLHLLGDASARLLDGEADAFLAWLASVLLAPLLWWLVWLLWNSTSLWSEALTSEALDWSSAVLAVGVVAFAWLDILAAALALFAKRASALWSKWWWWWWLDVDGALLLGVANVLVAKGWSSSAVLAGSVGALAEVDDSTVALALLSDSAWDSWWKWWWWNVDDAFLGSVALSVEASDSVDVAVLAVSILALAKLDNLSSAAALLSWDASADWSKWLWWNVDLAASTNRVASLLVASEWSRAVLAEAVLAVAWLGDLSIALALLSEEAVVWLSNWWWLNIWHVWVALDEE